MIAQAPTDSQEAESICRTNSSGKTAIQNKTTQITMAIVRTIHHGSIRKNSPK